MKTILKISILLLSIAYFSCGEGTVEVTQNSYEPKITIEGFLIAGQKVEKIRISRNFPVDANLLNYDLVLENADVKIIDESNTNVYPLTFHLSQTNFDSNWFDYLGNDLIIEPGNKYTLDVIANVDGKNLHAWSTTKVPANSFKITDVNYTQLKYRQKDASDNLIRFEVTFDRSPGTTFYVTTVKAFNATTDNFIYDNPFFDTKPSDIADDLDDFNYSYFWTQDTPIGPGQTKVQLFWTNFWFYSEYEVIFYSADNNYKEFLQTFNDVQEPDGNFHQPIFHIEGDGIGVFGSMIADTTYLQVTK